MHIGRKSAVVGIVLFGLVPACSGNDSGDEVGDEATEVISADTGGTVELGATRVQFPANAFSEDTEVSMRIASLDDFEPLENAREIVLVFEPAMALAASAVIEMDPGDPDPGDSGFAFLSQFVDGTWIGVDASTTVNAEGLIESSIYRLAPTVVVVVPPVPPAS